MARTKEQILGYMKTLDTSVLQRLERYSEFLVIPDESLLTNATMIQLVDKAHELADTLFPEWTDRSKSDFGEFLVELFAVFSEKDFWYINAFANEGVLRRMRLYSNAFSQASALGYTPTLCHSAYGSFEASFAAGEAVVYGIGDLVLNVAGTKFTNDGVLSLPASNSAYTKGLRLREGTYYFEDIPYNGYCLYLRKKNIDVDSIMVTTDDLAWERVSNFGMSGSDSAHFMVLPEEDGSCSIYFGCDGFGKQPSLGKSIRVGYRRCKGSDGNVQYNEVDVDTDLSARPIASVTMIGDAEGGTYAESLTSIKEKAPAYAYTKRAALNEYIAQRILNSFPFIYQSKVWVDSSDVHFRVIPTSGNPNLSSVEISKLSTDFYPYLMLGYTPVYETNVYRDLLSAIDSNATKIKVTLYVLEETDRVAAEASARQIMDDVTNPLISANYGKGFSCTEVMATMLGNITGLQNVVFKYNINNGDTYQAMSDVSIGANEIFSAIDQDDLIIEFIER